MSDSYKTYDSLVCVENLTKSADGDAYSNGGFCELSFSFEKKGIHCILAPKYSGKTQILDILSGCDSEYEGDVDIFGRNPYLNIKAKKKIGYLRKNNTLYANMTVFETMSFVGDTRGVESGKLYRQIKEALELVGLDDLKNRLVGKLTEYDKKKLSIAAALLGNPDILLFDEPITKNMSDERRGELEQIISMLGRIKTVIITTDECSIARSLAEDVVIISDGQVLAKGRFEELDRKLAESDNPITLEALYNTLTYTSAE